MKTDLKLFSFTTGAFHDDLVVSMPGFSHRSQPFKQTVTWYPFEEWKIRVFLFARNRSHAAKQIQRALLNDARDLDGGSKADVPECIAKIFLATK